MSAAKHSPGPWGVAGSTVYGEYADFHFHIAVVNANYPEHIATQEANARLIAAAPELLEALQQLLQLTECYTKQGYQLDDARAAIAKATTTN